MAIQIKKAVKEQIFLRIGCAGPSGSGKTYSSLVLAQKFASSPDKIVLIDTERRSSLLYAGDFDFQVIELAPPYSPARYREAIKAAEEYGAEVLIIDSLTHAWAGEGGMLEEHDKWSAKEKNSFAAWRHITPDHNRLVDSLLAFPGHVIATMRTKSQYEITEDSRGKKAPKKIGLAPIFRDGIEYEFTLVFDLDIEGNLASASKDRTKLFMGQAPHQITIDTAQQLIDWMEGGITVKEAILNEINAANDEASFVAVWNNNKSRIESLPFADKEAVQTAFSAKKQQLTEKLQP